MRTLNSTMRNYSQRMIVMAMLAIAFPVAPAHAVSPGDDNLAAGGDPTEQQLTTPGGGHKHLWLEHRLYGTQLVHVPHSDLTVRHCR
jgi:hypothetical protein